MISAEYHVRVASYAIINEFKKEIDKLAKLKILATNLGKVVKTC